MSALSCLCPEGTSMSPSEICVADCLSTGMFLSSDKNHSIYFMCDSQSYQKDILRNLSFLKHKISLLI